MATAWGQVDFIGGTQHMKELIKAPFTGDPVSLALHRVGDSILLGTAPLLPWEGGAAPPYPPGPASPAVLPSSASPPWALSQGAIHLLTNSSLPPVGLEDGSQADPTLDPPIAQFDPPPQKPVDAASASTISYAAATAAATRPSAQRGVDPPPPLQGALEKRFVLQTGSGVDTVSHLEEHVLPLVSAPRVKHGAVKLPPPTLHQEPPPLDQPGCDQRHWAARSAVLHWKTIRAFNTALSLVGARTLLPWEVAQGGQGGQRGLSLTLSCHEIHRHSSRHPCLSSAWA